MSEPEYHDYEVELHAVVSAPDASEAQASLERSGLIAGALIGETLIESTEIYDPDG